MARRNYYWRLPYRPRGFYRDAPLDFQLSLDIDRSSYEFWVGENESMGSESGFDGFYYEDDLDVWTHDSLVIESDIFDSLMDEMVEMFIDRIEDKRLMNQADTVNYILSFVHQFPYSSDKRSTGISEYARFPIETLYDKTGDCECLAVLFAALIAWGDVAPVALFDVKKRRFFSRDEMHMAAGVANDADDSMFGTYVNSNGSRYFYCEATGCGHRVGEIPDDFRGADFIVYPVLGN